MIYEILILITLWLIILLILFFGWSIISIQKKGLNEIIKGIESLNQKLNMDN